MENKNKLKLIITKGLQGSGKSTWADAYISKNTNFIKVEKDDIRKNSHLFVGGVYNHQRGDEAIVVKERDRIIHRALANGKSVISSDTNLVQKHITQMSNIAKEYGASVEIKSFLDVPLKELIRRDEMRLHPVGEQVIRKTFHDHVKTMPTFLKYNPKLPFAVVSDLDGTLTLGPKNRSPYEWAKVGNDDINLGVAHMLDGVKVIKQCKVFIFSGRDSVCRQETEEWLEKNDIEYDELHMRGKDDNRSDEIVKAEMIEDYIKNRYNVLIWFDDRKRVSDMLRDVYGINVAQIGDTNFHF